MAEDACIGVSLQVARVGRIGLGLRVQNLREVAQLDWYARVPAVSLLDSIENRGVVWLIHEVVGDRNSASKALCDMADYIHYFDFHVSPASLPFTTHVLRYF